MLSFAPSAAPAERRARQDSPDISALGEHASAYMAPTPITAAHARELIAGHAVGPQRLALYNVDRSFNAPVLAAVVAWIRPSELVDEELPMAAWSLFERHPPHVVHQDAWAARFDDAYHVVWRVAYAHTVRTYMALEPSGAAHVHMPLRIATSERHALAPPMWQLRRVHLQFDRYRLVESDAAVQAVALSGLTYPATCGIETTTGLPARRLDLAVSLNFGMRDAQQSVGVRLVGTRARDTLDELRVDRLVLTVAMGNAGCASFRMRAGGAAEQEWTATRVGDDGADFVPVDPRLAARLGRVVPRAPDTADLLPSELFVVLSPDCTEVVGCNAGTELLPLFWMGRDHLVVRVHLEGADQLPSVGPLPARPTMWEARRDLCTEVDRVRMVREYFLPQKGAARLVQSTYAAPLGADSVATLRMVFRFTLDSGEFHLETRDHADPMHRTALFVPRRQAGLVVSAFLYGTAQMGHGDTPLLFDTGANQDAPLAPPVPMDADGPGRYGEQPPSAATLPPFAHTRRTLDTAQQKPALAHGKRALMRPPEGHPRLSECLEHKTSPVWFGLSLSGLDPRVRRSMVPNAEAVLLYNDPGALLTRAGVYRLRVHVHCDYRQTAGDDYTRQAPLTLQFDLTNPESPYCVGGSFDRDATPGWPTTQADY